MATITFQPDDESERALAALTAVSGVERYKQWSIIACPDCPA